MKNSLEREHGWMHEIFCWKNDPRWPAKQWCKEKGYDQRQTVAKYTWVRLFGKGHQAYVRGAKGWLHPEVPFRPSEEIVWPLVVIRVQLPQRRSQYLGWMSPEELQRIEVVNWAHKGTWMVRMVHPNLLTRGVPDCCEVKA